MDISVLTDATVYNNIQPVDRIFDADVQSLFFYRKLHATGKQKKMYLVIVIEQYSTELFIYYVMTMYRLCIYYYYYLGSSGLS